jgi:hypothetical protein
VQRLPVAVSIFTVLFFIVSLTGNVLIADPSLTSVAFADDKGGKKKGKSKKNKSLKGNKGLRQAVTNLQGRVGSLETAPPVPGVPGPKGEQGIQGIPGNDGTDGLPGADSTVAGPPGSQGIQGIPGPQGEQGPPGEDGAHGLPGADSIVAGPQGIPGPQGPAGEIEPGFYEGLNADQVDGLHVSEIIEAATSGSGGGSGRFEFVGITSLRAAGNVQIGGFADMCNNDYPGSRICNTKEVYESINPFPTSLPEPVWVMPYNAGSSMYPYSSTGPAYNDNCDAWSNGTTGFHGAVIMDRGRISWDYCNAVNPVACCAIK